MKACQKPGELLIMLWSIQIFPVKWSLCPNKLQAISFSFPLRARTHTHTHTHTQSLFIEPLSQIGDLQYCYSSTENVLKVRLIHLFPHSQAHCLCLNLALTVFPVVVRSWSPYPYLAALLPPKELSLFWSYCALLNKTSQLCPQRLPVDNSPPVLTCYARPSEVWLASDFVFTAQPLQPWGSFC